MVIVNQSWDIVRISESQQYFSWCVVSHRAIQPVCPVRVSDQTGQSKRADKQKMSGRATLPFHVHWQRGPAQYVGIIRTSRWHHSLHDRGDLSLNKRESFSLSEGGRDPQRAEFLLIKRSSPCHGEGMTLSLSLSLRERPPLSLRERGHLCH